MRDGRVMSEGADGGGDGKTLVSAERDWLTGTPNDERSSGLVKINEVRSVLAATSALE